MDMKIGTRDFSEILVSFFIIILFLMTKKNF